MRKNLIHFLLVAVFSVCSTLAFAQTTTVRGQLVDSETGEPLIGATVMVEGTTQGSITDVDGYFEQSVASGATLLFKYVGYKDLTKKITQKGASTDLGIIKMEPDAVMLKDVVVTSSVAVARKTPVAVSTIQPVFIEEKLGTKEFPEILKSTPGVYATKQGGGFGDSRINMRGFESENIAVMINGVPMNDMEWGGVYWSNWAGLSDVTRSMQTQRGLGASKVSAPSVGGSINIVTKTVDAEKGGSISYALGNDGLNKLMFNVSTGMSKSGWALTLLGAKTWADGYIQGTEYEAYNWFINLTKRFNDNHQLSFTGFGAPQWHNQRNNNDGLRISEWQKVAERYMNGDSPYKYNPTFGYGLNGERKTSARNAYHKPQLSLNHLWQIDSKSSLSTALYASIGNGYGYSGQGLTSTDRTNWYGASDGIVNTTFRHADGTFAYDEIYALNQASENGSVMATASLPQSGKVDINKGQNSVYYFSQEGSPYDPTGIDPAATVYTVDNLSDLVRKLPDNIQVDCNDGRVNVKQGVLHSIALNRTYSGTINYDVLVPFIFNSGMTIVYTDSIADMNEDLKDYQAEGFDVTGEAYNTVPMELVADIEPLDLNGNVLTGITVTPATIAAGTGLHEGEDNNGAVKSNITITLTAQNPADVSRIDKLRFHVTAGSEAQGALYSNQYFSIQNLRLKLKGQIIGDFN